jgi:hypothetical protein
VRKRRKTRHIGGSGREDSPRVDGEMYVYTASPPTCLTFTFSVSYNPKCYIGQKAVNRIGRSRANGAENAFIHINLTAMRRTYHMKVGSP